MLTFTGLAIVGGFAFWKFNKAKGQSPAGNFDDFDFPDPPSDTTTTAKPSPKPLPAPAKTYRPDHFPLSIYSKGDKVKGIQATLNQKFNTGLKVDGFWGPNTQNALKRHGQPTHFKLPADLERWYRTTGAVVNSWNKWATGLGIAPPGLQVVALEDTVIWDGARMLETVDSGEVMGTHVATQNGVSEIRTLSGERAFAKTIHLVFQ